MLTCLPAQQLLFHMSTAGAAQARQVLLAPSTEALLHSEDLSNTVEGPEVVEIFMACCSVPKRTWLLVAQVGSWTSH